MTTKSPKATLKNASLIFPYKLIDRKNHVSKNNKAECNEDASKNSVLNFESGMMHCVVCKRTGDLVQCPTCNHLSHPGCLPDTTNDNFSFCAKCRTLGEKFTKPWDWLDSLVLIHDFIQTNYEDDAKAYEKIPDFLINHMTNQVHSDCGGCKGDCRASERCKLVVNNFLSMFEGLSTSSVQSGHSFPSGINL